MTNDLTKPIPAAVSERGEFEVIPTPPQWGAILEFDKGSNVMAVPLDDSPEAVAIRCHEYTHLELERRFPKLADAHVHFRKSKGDEGWWQTALDVVVNSYAQTKGLPIDSLPLDNLPFSAPLMHRASNFVRSIGIKAASLLQSGLNISEEHTANLLRQNLYRVGLEAARSGELRVEEIEAGARALQLLFTPVPPAKEDAPIDAKDSSMMRRAARLALTSGSKLSDLLTEEVEARDIADERAYAPGSYGTRWGRMTVKKYPLPLRAIRSDGEKRRTGFIGALRRPSRLLLPAMDGRAWERKRRFAGGTLVIDRSGSMHIRKRDLLLAIKLAPLQTIAIYEGTGMGYGYLHVLAQGGRYTIAIPRACGKANEIDGPVLDWMGKQLRPRVWICDGAVTGVRDQGDVALYRDAMAKVKRHHITRFSTLSGYLSYVLKKKGTSFEEALSTLPPFEEDE